MSTNRTIVATAGLLLALLVLVGSVSAVPSVSISPTSGDVGDTVTITGTGFNATENVSVWYGTDQVTRNWDPTDLRWENITYPSLNATAGGKLNHAIADAQGFWKLKFDTFAPEQWTDMNQTVDVTVKDADGTTIGPAKPYSGGPDGVVFDVNDPVVTINVTSGGDNTPIQINVSNLRRNDVITAISFGATKVIKPTNNEMKTGWNSLAGKWGNVTTPKAVASATSDFIDGQSYTVTVYIQKDGTGAEYALSNAPVFTYTGVDTGGPYMWLNSTPGTATGTVEFDGVTSSSDSLPNINSFDSRGFDVDFPLAFRVTNFSTSKEIAANSITVGGVSTVHAEKTVGQKTNKTFYPVNLSSKVSMGPATVNIGGSEFTAISSQPYGNTTENAHIALSTSEGVKGDTVYVYGYGFDDDVDGSGTPEDVTLKFGTSVLDLNDQGAGTVNTQKSVTVDERGAFAVNFSVPTTATTGSNTISAYQNYSTTLSAFPRATATFTVSATAEEPTITLNKTSANVGDKVGIKFANFEGAKAKVTMDDGTVLNSSMATSATWYDFTVPTISGRTYIITAENSSKSETATAELTIAPDVTDYIPGDIEVYADDSYELRGDGFVSGTRYAILWNAAENGGELIGDFYAKPNGEIPDDGTATFTIPTSTNGKHLIDIATYADQTSSILYGNMLWTGEPEGSAYPNQNFTGATYFQAAPLNPQIGDSITITGSNLDANDVVRMEDWNGVNYTLTADASGSVTRTWTVPYLNNTGLTPGMDGQLKFVGSRDYGTVDLLVYDNVDLSKTSGAPGEQITVTGNGFMATPTPTRYYIFLNQSSTGTDSYVGLFDATSTRGAIPTGTKFTVPPTLATGTYNVLIVSENTWPAAGQVTNHDIPTFTLSGALDHITVTPETASLDIGDTQSFTCTGYDGEGNVVTVTPEWSVDNEVGTINSEGLFQANENGTATVTATVTQSGSTFTDTATVTVGGAGPTPTIDSIEATPTSLDLNVGETGSITAVGKDASGDDVPLTSAAVWESVNPSVATVDGSAGSATVTAVAAGTTTITVSEEGVTSNAVTINVYENIVDRYKDPSTGKVEDAGLVLAIDDWIEGSIADGDLVSVIDAWIEG